MPRASKSFARVLPPARIATSQTAAGELERRRFCCGSVCLQQFVFVLTHDPCWAGVA